MNPRIVTTLLLVSLLLAGCGTKPEKKLPPPRIKVGAMPVEKGDIKQTLDMSGNLRFIANTTVSSEVAAQVKSLEVRDGQPVKKGQVLLRFDDTTIKAVADQAQGNLQKDEAALAFNKAEWEKNAQLFQTGAISQSVYDQKVSAYRSSLGQVEADRGALAKAMEDLKHTVVSSPIDGLLSARFVEKGDWVATGGKLFQISDYTTIYVATYLSDKDVAKLNVEKVIQEGEGVEARVSVDSLPGKLFRGKVGYVQPVTNQNRLFEVRIYIDNRKLELLEGMYARARVLVHRIPEVVRVPIDALLEQVRTNSGNTVVQVDKEARAHLTRIKIGARDDLFAEVLEGLQPGDRVVIEGKEVLSSGQPLEVALRAPPGEDTGMHASETSGTGKTQR